MDSNRQLIFDGQVKLIVESKGLFICKCLIPVQVDTDLSDTMKFFPVLFQRFLNKIKLFTEISLDGSRV